MTTKKRRLARPRKKQIPENLRPWLYDNPFRFEYQGGGVYAVRDLHSIVLGKIVSTGPVAAISKFIVLRNGIRRGVYNTMAEAAHALVPVTRPRMG